MPRQMQIRANRPRWASALMLGLLCACGQPAAESPDDQPARPAKENTKVLKVVPASGPIEFRGTCDGSAAALLANGQIAVANDEDPIIRFYHRDGTKLGNELNLAGHISVKGDAEPDIEGAAVEGDWIYWITSHGRDNDKEFQPDRHRLFATTRDGPTKVTARSFSGLMTGKSVEALGLSNAEPLRPEEGGINIEAIAAGPDEALLLGFRSPLTGAKGLEGRASVIPLINAAALVGGSPAGQVAEPQFGKPITLDLGNRGIRDMIRFRDGYLLIAGSVGKSGTFALFGWDGSEESAPVELTRLDGLNAEALVDLGNGELLVLSDEGDTPMTDFGDIQCKKLGKIKKNEKPNDGGTQEAFEKRKANERANRRFKGQIYRVAVQT